MTVMPQFSNTFTQQANIKIPIIGGAMYPCSNPELVAAVSNAGGIGIIQPLSLTYVHGYSFREGIHYIRQLTDKPIGMNVLIEKSSRKYHTQMVEWLNIATEEGIRFFVTSLGKPDWVCEKVHETGGIVYHDVTEGKWADKAVQANVDGLIAVNNRAGGHAGSKSPEELYNELQSFNLPVICAGGISTSDQFKHALALGYCGVQIGTRFIASKECSASLEYKQAIVDAVEEDIVLSERITGVPVSVIRTPYVERTGTRPGLLARWMLRGQQRKRFMRTLYTLRSLWQLKSASQGKKYAAEYWQAGKSVTGIHSIESISDIFTGLTKQK